MRFLIDVYFLADRLLDPVTANVVIDELIHFLDNQDGLCTAAIIHICASTRDGSLLRTVLRDIYIPEYDGSWALDAQAQGLPYEFLQDCLVEIGRLKEEEDRDAKIEEAFEMEVAERQAGHYHQVIKQETEARDRT